MTYSIAAVDSDSGAAGVATVTGGLAVGALVPYARAGAGAIATQGASTNWLYGERGLALLQAGGDAETVMREMTTADSGRDHRQCAIVDRGGRSACWTGVECETARSEVVRPGTVAAGNRLRSEEVTEAMVASFESGAGGRLADRLINALSAGEAAGGDRRGVVSAALIVDFPDRPPINLRVDYAPEVALEVLRELYERYCSSPTVDFYQSLPTRADFSRWQRLDDG